MKNDVSFGALPSTEDNWQSGKTAASIRFVNEATILLDDPMSYLSLDEKIKLRCFCMSLKNGTQSLHEWLSVKDFLNKK